jgi:iron complex outermembrane recepter protein
MKTEKHLSHPLPKKLVAATWSALSVMAVVSMSAQAQTAPVAEKVQRVEVTGSSIKRVDAETALPVQIITRKDIEKTGALNAEQLLSTISANTGFTKESASISDKPGSSGLSGANLRGLGVSSTLVLLNGRRLAPYGFGGEGTDLNSIPLTALDRVEVLKDGASAVYGADAVGGVINFITRKDFTGAEFSVSGSKTQDGGGGDKAFSALLGYGNLDNNGFNVFASLQHQQYDQLRANQRDFAKSAWQPFAERGYPDSRDILTSSNPFPANIYTRVAGTRPDGSSIARRTAIGGPDYPNCAGEGQYKGGQGLCRYDYQESADLDPESKKTNFIARAVFKVSESNKVFAEFTASRNDAKYRISPTGINGNRASLPPTDPTKFDPTATYAFVYPSGGRFYPATYVDTKGVTQSTSAAPLNGGPFGVRMRMIPGGQRTNGQISDQQRLLVGSEGIFAGWDYNTALSHATSKNTQSLTNGYYDKQKLVTAFNKGDINPFGPQDAAGQAALDGAERNIDGRKGKSTFDSFDARLTKEIAQISAGAVSFATGFEIRREKLEDNSSDEILAGTIYSTSKSRRVSESRNIKAAFGELELPITKTLSSQLAARYDTYGGTIGSSLNPKVAVRFQPVSQLLFRASYGTGFRAPTLKDLDPSKVETTTSGLYYDATGCKLDSFNCGTPAALADQIKTLESGNPNLKPEKSKQASMGVLWEPNASFSAGVDFWTVRKTDVIKFAPETLFVLDPEYVEKFIQRDADSVITNWELTAQNQGKETKTGFDINLIQRSNLGKYGKVRTALSGTIMVKSTQQYAATSTEFDNLGKWGFEYVTPKWRHNLSTSWDLGNWGATLSNTFQLGHKDQNPGPDGVSEARVASYSLWDINAAYTGFGKLKLSGGIDNILNTDPPFSNQSLTYFGGFDSSYADPKGRTYYVKLSYSVK